MHAEIIIIFSKDLISPLQANEEIIDTLLWDGRENYAI